MAKTTKPLYVWEREIKGISDNIIDFKDGPSETYTAKQLKYIITEEPKDLTQFNDLVILNVVNDVIEVIKSSDINDLMWTSGKILDVYEEHDIKMNQIDTIGITILTKLKEVIQTVANSYMVSYKEAIWKAFWTYKEWTHYDYFIDNIKMSDIRRLKQQ